MFQGMRHILQNRKTSFIGSAAEQFSKETTLTDGTVNSVPATFAGSNFQVPFWTAVGAAVLLSMLGVLAGIGPTAHAMSIKPVDAMREE